jgi:hypothetical protein
MAPRPQRQRLQRPYEISAGPVYWGIATVAVLIGVVLLAAPQNWYGPSWSYYHQYLPSNGHGMGMCCVALGGLQMVALWRNASAKVLSVLFGLGGFVYMTAGTILAAEGLQGHQGLMEAPFILVIGAHKLIHSSALMRYYRQQRRQQ